MVIQKICSVIIILTFITAGRAQSQPTVVTGTVLYNPKMNDCFQEVPCFDAVALTDAADWIPPKAAVNIMVKGTGKAVKTNPEGKYSIEIPPGSDTLLFCYIGHNRLEVPIQHRREIDVKLTPTPIPVIDRLMKLIMPILDAGKFPDIDELARNGQVNRATARDLLWLVLGNQRMKQHYPGEFIPDYRFSQ